MHQMSMMEWLVKKIDQLEQSGIQNDEVAIAISPAQEQQFLIELDKAFNIRPLSVHHCTWYDWRIIVKGRN